MLVEDLIRCPWSDTTPLYIRYHDEEWGNICHDDNVHYEYLVMEVMQCGLSWGLMLKKREIFRKCFSSFDCNIVANYTENDVKRILSTEGMIKSEPKIRAIIANSKHFLEIQKEFGSFDNYIWGFSDNNILIYKNRKGVTQNDISQLLSKDMRKRGIKYLGPTVMYSHLQAVGIIFSHSPQCWRYKRLMESCPKNIKYIG